MAIVNPIQNQEAWDSWVATRPASVQELIKKLPPDRLYRIKETGHRCTIYSYAENGTVTVNVTGEWNRVVFGRAVFGVPPEDLEEWDLPTPEEKATFGDTSKEAGYTEEDIRNILIPRMKEFIPEAKNKIKKKGKK